jgi:glutamine phosphoribosylpyrophosphate amidotransferase
VKVMSAGDSIEIFKEVGLPKDVAARFDVARMHGTHGIGHTRMATESAVTTMGAHPFSTGSDQCLVHNGSLSNHNGLRRELIRKGMTFETENDTEVAAAFISHKLQEGEDLGTALEATLDRSGRLLHLCRRHQERLWRRPRPHRLQARRDGRNRPIRRLRLGIPRAGQPAGHRGRPRLGTRTRHCLLLGALRECRVSTWGRKACAR